ncbi:MAG TPA: hypothetical protein VF234_03675 [Limnochordia bacterium]
MRLAAYLYPAGDWSTVLQSVRLAGCAAVEIAATDGPAPGNDAALFEVAAAARAQEMSVCAIDWGGDPPAGQRLAAALGAAAVVVPAADAPSVPLAGVPVYAAAPAGSGELVAALRGGARALAAIVAGGSPAGVAAELERCQAGLEHVRIRGAGGGWLTDADRDWLLGGLRVLHRIGYEGYLVVQGPPDAADPLAAAPALRRLRRWVDEAWAD